MLPAMCYGCFDEFDDYCWYCCPCSVSCEHDTYGCASYWEWVEYADWYDDCYYDDYDYYW